MILSALETRLRAATYSTAVTQSACKAMEFGELGIPIDSSRSCVLQLPMTAGRDQSDWWLTDWLNVFIMTSDKPQMKLQWMYT